MFYVSVFKTLKADICVAVWGSYFQRPPCLVIYIVYYLLQFTIEQ